MTLNYLTATEVAKRLGCSTNSVGRAAREAGVGVLAGGRIVAVAPEDVSKLSQRAVFRGLEPKSLLSHGLLIGETARRNLF